MYEHVLLAIDGSDEAETAARHGLAIARRLDAAISVLYVVERRSLRLARRESTKSRLKDRGEAALTKVEELASGVENEITTILREGKPTEEILRVADETGADLLAVGRRGRSSLGDRLLGGVTESMLHHSDVPVLVVPASDRTVGEVAYSHVLLPTDGSENADAATPHGVALARAFGSTVHVLNVVDVLNAGGPFHADGLQEEFIARLEAQGTDAVERTRREITESAPELTVETAVVRSKSFPGAASGIKEYATDEQIDLIVIGSHGRSDIKRQLLGSVASTVLRTADVPVVVVNRSTDASR